MKCSCGYSIGHPLVPSCTCRINTNDYLCALLRQVHDVLAVSSLPPERKWVGLTVDEILDCYKDNLDRTMFVYIVQTIEAKLKEKNNG